MIGLFFHNNYSTFEDSNKYLRIKKILIIFPIFHYKIVIFQCRTSREISQCLKVEFEKVLISKLLLLFSKKGCSTVEIRFDKLANI